VHGTFRIILVSDRRTKDGEDGVTDEFLDEAIVATDLLGQGLETTHHQTAEFFRVELFG
jgi:hypothetical protein